MTGALALTVGLAVLIGVSLGLLGGGGSILAVPLLVYVAGLPAQEAIAISLLVVGVTSAVALVPHSRAGRVRWRTGLLFGLAGMAGAYAGGRLATFIPTAALLTAFAVMMLGTAVKMLRGRRACDEPTPRELSVGRALAAGVAVGLLSGLFGAGGGFVVVPALTLVGGLPMPAAVGTSLLVIAMQTLAGFTGHLSSVSIDWRLAAAVTAAATLGSLAGGRLAGRIPADLLRRAFGWFVVVMGVFVLAQQLPADLGLGLAAVAALAVAGTVAVAVVRHRQKERHSGQQRLGRPVRQHARSGVER
ncbi:sulfite exporter TauE/SafE family protein [Micromonospora sp. RTP1Z1]|uniref:sulfite exporter TauE/SafE family protein n=1 Tax=Micromonospora sp. RTP1Z1 TaxID=2994043 RepID=UPI0029C86178|nr:sulfite exporter TauE/SafE family protein [Micromonospora sp. RTP1Z1]